MIYIYKKFEECKHTREMTKNIFKKRNTKKIIRKTQNISSTRINEIKNEAKL